MKLIFDPKEIQKASEFLEKNNSLCKQTSEEWEEQIYKYIKGCADRDSSFAGTGGFIILFDQIDIDCVSAEVYVSPNIGEYDSVEAELVDGRIMKEFG